MLIHKSHRIAPQRQGGMLPLIAVLLPVIIVFLGFSVDLAYMQMTRLELRAATDAAARSAATELSLSDNKIRARIVAKQIAKDNTVGGKGLQIQNKQIEFGRSERNNQGRWVFNKGGKPANSVRVTGNRLTKSANGGIPLFFGSFYGVKDFEPEHTAIASFLNVDICLVLDRSTSMKVDVDSDESGLYTSDYRFCRPPTAKSRWASLEKAVGVFANALRKTNAKEMIALATYSSDLGGSGFCGVSDQASSLDLPLNEDISLLTGAMNKLGGSVWNGNTDIESGMRTGVGALLDNSLARKTADKVMIVMTDGNENEGSCIAAAKDIALQGVMIHAITFGDFSDRVRMADVARIGGGRYLHASNAADLERVFRELAAQMSQLTE